MSTFAKDYVDVATRLVEFREKYPDGSLQPVNPQEPVKIREVGGKTYLEYVAAAYRTPDDPRPGIGVTWEPIPGATQFTRDSEAQNAETSAWGRAIVAALAADTKKGVASANEIANRRAAEPVDAGNAGVDLAAISRWIDKFKGDVAEASTVQVLNTVLWPQLKTENDSGRINSRQYKDLINTMGRRKQDLEAADQAALDRDQASQEEAS